MLYVLGHGKTTSQNLYGLERLIHNKVAIGAYLLSGDYLHFIPDERYRPVRQAVMGAGIKLMNELRAELKASPPVLPEMTAPKPGKLEGEQLASVMKELRWQERRLLEKSSDILDYKELPEKLARIEAKFVPFAEQEFRRVPPEKGEMEDIIARAGLPKESSARLRLLIPR